MAETKKPATAARKAKTEGAFSDDERAAMKERAAEVKASRGAKKAADGEADVRASIAKMDGPDRELAERIHTLVTQNAPELSPKTWYGMPAYANAEGKVVCFFQNASKFKARYSTLGFNDAARLDDGQMWATTFALLSLTAADEKKIITLLKKATG